MKNLNPSTESDDRPSWMELAAPFGSDLCEFCCIYKSYRIMTDDSIQAHKLVRACVCVGILVGGGCACVRACVRACVCVCVHNKNK